MGSVCPTASISSLQSAHDLDAICVSVVAWRHVTCGPLRIKCFIFLRGRKNGANDGNYFLISLQPVASWKTFLLHSNISLYPVSLSVSGVSPEVRGIANTIRTQSKWLFTPLHKAHWTIPTSIITSMDLNETKKPFYCIVIVQKNRVHLCGWSMQSYSNALCSHQTLQCCIL